MSPASARSPLRHLSASAGAVLAVVAAIGFGVGAASCEERLRLGLPIACTPGEDCVIQNYFDHDPAPTHRDHTCGHMTYDGHDGTDFRLPTTSDLNRGVMVLAAAPGRVTSTRRDVPDDGLKRGAAAIAGVECGNGVMIDHGGGWTTQYCHMAMNSITVAKGDTVARGGVLGRVGYSGQTAMPHLHLTVRRDGKAIDPFAPDRAGEACGPAQETLWLPDVEKQLVYRSPFVLLAGFASENVEITHVEEFGLPPFQPRADQPALIAVAYSIGIERTDVLSLDLFDPTGRQLVHNATPPFARPKASWMIFGGTRRPATGYVPGTWRAQFRIWRNGAIVADRSFTVDMPAP